MRLSWEADYIFSLSDSGPTTVSCAALRQLLAFSGLNVYCSIFYPKKKAAISTPSCTSVFHQEVESIFLSLWPMISLTNINNECWVNSMNIQFLWFLKVLTLRGASVHERKDHHAVKKSKLIMCDNRGGVTTSLRKSKGQEVSRDIPIEFHDGPVQTTSQCTKLWTSEVTRKWVM